MSRKQSHYIHLDLIVLLLAFATISLLSIYNAQQLGQYNTNFVLRQAIYYGIGISLLIVLQFFETEILFKLGNYLYIFGVVILILLHFSPPSIAVPVNGSLSWFNKIPFVTIQPSEFTKIAMIVFFAMLVVKHQTKYELQTLTSDLWLIAKIVIASLIPVFFVLKQPDLGTSLVILFIAAIIIIVSGIDWKILSTIVIGGLAFVVLAVYLIVQFPEMATKVLGIQPYQIKRVTTWFDPTVQVSDDTFQIDRSLLTLGSGQITGKGMSNAEVSLPEAHTDFIFSIVGESFGFVGATLVILLFFLLIYRLVTLGMAVFEKNPFGSYICFGYMALILIHTIENIGMTIGLMPITGIPLLFISYGGSTILSTMIGYGIVYRIAVEHSKEEESIF